MCTVCLKETWPNHILSIVPGGMYLIRINMNNGQNEACVT